MTSLPANFIVMRTVVQVERYASTLNRVLAELEPHEEAAIITELHKAIEFTAVVYYGRYTNVI